MSVNPSTPRNKAGPSTSTPAAAGTPSHATTTPVIARASAATHNVPSPHYTTTRRHSLYGTEDRVVIDPGSMVWKVGFSGEGRPRDVSYANPSSVSSLWRLERAADATERLEEERMLSFRLEQRLRTVFLDCLMTAPNTRKIIVVEQPLMPLYIKELLSRILFTNLQVPSVSFVSSHLLSLLAVGRITGLVLDCGNLESIVLPIFSSRPLFPQLQTTPLAGSRLSSHLRGLLLLFGSYIPPPTTLSGPTTVPKVDRTTRVPDEVLTSSVVEDIKTRCCFVGSIFGQSSHDEPEPDDSMDMDVPPSDSVQSESEYERSSSAPPESAESSSISRPRRSGVNLPTTEAHLLALASMYKQNSTATDIRLRVMPTVSQRTGTGRGTLIIPGWIRERAAEVLFEGGDIDESSVAEVILDTLLKTPVDLRKTLASSIVVAGGTAMLPGFIPRLHTELVRALQPPVPSPNSPRKPYDRYSSLRFLIPYFAIVNNPSPPPAETSRAAANVGKAPAFTPATLSWIGGSLAGAMKISGIDVSREKWDEAGAPPEGEEEEHLLDLTVEDRIVLNVLPDWTRKPLPMGAPSARINAAMPASPQTAVGA